MTIYDDLSKEQPDQRISDGNELFRRAKKNIAEYKNVNYAELIKKCDAWISNHKNEQAQKIGAVQEEIIFSYTPEQRKLYFLSERGNLSVDEWNENAHKHYLVARGGKDVDAKVSSSNVIKPEISSDTIINDTNKEIGITDTTNETSVVAESASDEELESSAISNEPEVVVEIADLAAELLSDSNETPPTISPSFDNSISETIDFAEEATNLDVVSSRVNLDDFYSSISNTNHAICTVKATNTKSPFTSFVHTVSSKFSSLWHSFTNSIHSKNESTGDTLLNVNSSSNTSFTDNFNDVKEHEIHCAGEGALDTGMLSIL